MKDLFNKPEKITHFPFVLHVPVNKSSPEKINFEVPINLAEGINTKHIKHLNIDSEAPVGLLPLGVTKLRAYEGRAVICSASPST